MQGAKYELGYLNFELLPKIIKLFKENELKQDDCYFLFVGEKGIFHTSTLESITSIDSNCFCTGSGSELVLGAMEAFKTNNTLAIKDKIKEAMKIATKFDSATGSPFYLLDIKSGKTEKYLSL